MDVLLQGFWGEGKKNKKRLTPSSFCLQWHISTTRCQSGTLPYSPCVRLSLAGVQLQPAQSGSKQIHTSFVYTLTRAFPIRSWESSGGGGSQMLREQLSALKWKSFFMCVFGVYDTATSIDGELSGQTERRLWWTRVVYHHSPPLSHGSTGWLIEGVRLTGDSGTWSSSRDKELLKALLNVSLFCLCRSMVDWITWDVEERREGMKRSTEPSEGDCIYSFQICHDKKGRNHAECQENYNPVCHCIQNDLGDKRKETKGGRKPPFLCSSLISELFSLLISVPLSCLHTEINLPPPLPPWEMF